MKKTVALAALLASLAVPAAAQTVVTAAGPISTQQFRMMAMMSDTFEIQSSRLALERSRNPRVLAYARKMINDHTTTTAALNGNRSMAVAANGAPAAGALTGGLIGAAVGGPVGAAVGAGVGATAGAPGGNRVAGTVTGATVGAVVGGPVGAVVGAGIGATAGGPLTTGSVAVGGAPLDARKSAMLAQLASTSGPSFDRLYGQFQRMSHEETLAVFTSYAQTGSDPAHVTFARSVIPHLQIHVSQARRLPGGRG